MVQHALSKPEFDIGFFTNKLEPTLAFWRQEIGLAYEAPVHFNDGLTQYRHALGNSIVKINAAQAGVDENIPGGYGDLFIAKAGLERSETKIDPNGNKIHFVPAGLNGITHLGLEVFAKDIQAEETFFLNALGCQPEPTGSFRSGNCCVFLRPDVKRAYAGHWVSAGFRYFTVHVMRVDEAYETIINNGGSHGEKPYAIGDIAKISFVRTPAGNWIEVAQRRELAGGW